VILKQCFVCKICEIQRVYADCRRHQDGKPVVKPEFKNAKVASLYDSWQRVVQLSVERRQRLQQMLDRLNEVSRFSV